MPESVALAPIEVLLVEDNPADVRATREALKLTCLEHRLHVVGDGESALAFVGRQGEFAAAPRPHLVLLDLALPGIGGHLVLARLRAERPALRVVVLTGSSDTQDLHRSFDLAADDHIVKSDSLLQFASHLMYACRLVGSHR